MKQCARPCTAPRRAPAPLPPPPPRRADLAWHHGARVYGLALGEEVGVGAARCHGGRQELQRAAVRGRRVAHTNHHL
jgi:hypothetical protein